MHTTIEIAALPAGAPDTELCRRATALVAKVSPPFLFNHCVRTFHFGDALGQRDDVEYDRELLYLSAMLHDIGLTDTYAHSGHRFEVEGADRARAFVVEHGLPDDKADIVWDAIALNTSFGIALRKGAEVALTHLGASADFLGTRLAGEFPDGSSDRRGASTQGLHRFCHGPLRRVRAPSAAVGSRHLSRDGRPLPRTRSSSPNLRGLARAEPVEGMMRVAAPVALAGERSAPPSRIRAINTFETVVVEQQVCSSWPREATGRAFRTMLGSNRARTANELRTDWAG